MQCMVHHIWNLKIYLETPMQSSEYAHIKLSNILQEIIDEYNLTTHTCYGWFYFDIIRGCYGLTQARKLVNDLLRVYLNKDDYYEAATTPGIWRHKWCPIIFDLIVYDFGIQYVGESHSQHQLHTHQELGRRVGWGLQVMTLTGYMLTNNLSTNVVYPWRVILTNFCWNTATPNQRTLNAAT